MRAARWPDLNARARRTNRSSTRYDATRDRCQSCLSTLDPAPSSPSSYQLTLTEMDDGHITYLTTALAFYFFSFFSASASSSGPISLFIIFQNKSGRFFSKKHFSFFFISLVELKSDDKWFSDGYNDSVLRFFFGLLGADPVNVADGLAGWLWSGSVLDGLQIGVHLKIDQIEWSKWTDRLVEWDVSHPSISLTSLSLCICLMKKSLKRVATLVSAMWTMSLWM